MSAFQHSSVYSLLIALKPSLVHPTEVELREEICTVGRASNCHVVIQHQLVSRLHAQIKRLGARYILADVGSANGTYLNGRRLLDEHQLRHDDKIGLGYPEPLLVFVDPDATTLAEGVLRYDDRLQSFILGGVHLELPPIQHQLLLHLYRNAGDICTRASCAQVIWGREYDPDIDSNALDSAVSELRRALRKVDAHADQILETRRGLGYALRL